MAFTNLATVSGQTLTSVLVNRLLSDDGSGNFGIGTTSPTEIFEVESSASTTGIQINNTATDGDPFLSFALSGTKKFTMGVDDGDSDKFKIGTTAIGTNTRLTIDGSGYVGIGTSSPGTNLDIVTGSITSSGFHLGEVSDEGGWLTSTSANQIILSAGGELVGGSWTARSTASSQINLSLGDIRFFCDTGLTDGVTFVQTEVARFDGATGYFGIGTNSPKDILEISETSGTKLSIRGTTENTSYNNQIVFATGSGVLSSTNSVAIIKSTITQADPSNLRGALEFLTNQGDTNTTIMYMGGSSSSVFIGDTANTSMSQGLTINQGAADDEILGLKSSDVAHGLTSIAETDTYCSFKKSWPSGGGLQVTAITDGDESVGEWAIMNRAYQRMTADTTTTTSGRGIFEVLSAQHDGAGSISDVAAAGNIVVFRNNATAEHIFKGDGDIYTNTDQTAGLAGTFDDQDDLALVEALRYGVKGHKPKHLVKHRKKLQELGIMQGTFLSDRGFKDLTLGSFGQMYKGLIFLAKQLGATEEQLKQAMIGA